MEAGSGEKVEEFVVLHQEPSASEAISPRVARPYIQALHSINLDAQQEDQQQQKKKKEEEIEQEQLAGKDATEGDQESESQVKEEPAHKEELNAVMEQVALYCLGNKNKYNEQKGEIRSGLALAILVPYARLVFGGLPATVQLQQTNKDKQQM